MKAKNMGTPFNYCATDIPSHINRVGHEKSISKKQRAFIINVLIACQ